MLARWSVLTVTYGDELCSSSCAVMQRHSAVTPATIQLPMKQADAM